MDSQGHTAKLWGGEGATGGQSGTRPYLYGCICPASMHLWLQQTLQPPRLRRQPKRTQVGVSHTRPPPLAAPGGKGGGHRAGGRAGSAVGAVSCWLRRWCGRQLQYRWVQGDWARGEGLRWTLRWPLPRWALQQHWPQRERLLLRPRRERQLRSVRRRPRPQSWMALLRRRGQVGEERGCHGG